MTIKSQLFKGILEGCILAIISKKEVYGYELSVQLHEYGLSEVSEGSIYPILLRLQKEEYISGEMRKSNAGPNRKYYSITAKGQTYLKTFITNWETISDSVNKIIGSDPNEN